ncbi:DUF397 domain-containing protein [Dactylosporangium sp. CA-052675]|uniref:DUF397 domain-containing protein n=1 Tax=Dactylosporangium sp. CA-052675 TaxID=3239927 RepID=UPI003D8B9209
MGRILVHGREVFVESPSVADPGMQLRTTGYWITSHSGPNDLDRPQPIRKENGSMSQLDGGAAVRRPLDRQWRKSSRSLYSDTCVEVRLHYGNVEVRDSKGDGTAVLTFTPMDWRRFVLAFGAGGA